VPEKENSSEEIFQQGSKEELENIADHNLLKNISNKYAIFSEGLVKDYEIGDFIVRAVDNISLSIENGQFLVIKGPSGAGKTSLLNLLGGLDSPRRNLQLWC